MYYLLASHIDNTWIWPTPCRLLQDFSILDTSLEGGTSQSGCQSDYVHLDAREGNILNSGSSMHHLTPWLGQGSPMPELSKIIRKSGYRYPRVFTIAQSAFIHKSWIEKFLFDCMQFYKFGLGSCEIWAQVNGRDRAYKARLSSYTSSRNLSPGIGWAHQENSIIAWSSLEWLDCENIKIDLELAWNGAWSALEAAFWTF